MKKIKIRVVFLCLLSLLLVWTTAYGASYVRYNKWGSRSWKWCMGTGPMATPTDVKNAMDKFSSDTISRLDDEVVNIENHFALVWGQGLGTEIRKNRLSNESLREFQANSIRDLVVGYASAGTVIDSQKTFGPSSRNENLEDMIEISAQYQASQNTAKQLIIKNESDFQVYENKWHSILESRSQIENIDQETISSGYLFPSTKTFGLDQVKDAAALHKQILDPVPIPQAKTNSENKKLEASQKLRTSQMLIPQRILFENMVDFSPSMNADRAVTVYQKASGTTDLPDSVKDNKISRSALIKLLADSKFANPNWYANLGAQNKTSMLRERLVVKALRLEQQKQQLKNLQLMAMTMAQTMAGKENKYHAPLVDALRDQAWLEKIRN